MNDTFIPFAREFVQKHNLPRRLETKVIYAVVAAWMADVLPVEVPAKVLFDTLKGLLNTSAIDKTLVHAGVLDAPRKDGVSERDEQLEKLLQKED